MQFNYHENTEPPTITKECPPSVNNKPLTLKSVQWEQRNGKLLERNDSIRSL